MNLRIVLFTVLFSFLTNFGFTQNEVSISSYLKSDYSIITVNNKSEDTVILTIVRENTNETIYKTIIEEKGLTKKIFNLSNLENGSYNIELSNNSECIFYVKNNKILKDIPSFYAANKTLFNISNESIFITSLYDDEKPISVSIINKKGIEFFEQEYNAQKSFTEKFDISHLPIGEYKLILKSKNNQCQYAFSK